MSVNKMACETILEIFVNDEGSNKRSCRTSSWR